MNHEIMEKYILAGKIAKEVRNQAAEMAKPGVKLLDIAEHVENTIRKRGAEPGFPLNLSLNDIAAHYTPKHNDELAIREGDVLKIDTGVHVDGYMADTAVTVQFGGHEELVKASSEALDAALDMIRPGRRISDISEAIEETIKSFGFVPVSNLMGHGVDRFVIHTEPSIPNVRTSSPKVLEEDMIIAIEPFATNGYGVVNDMRECLIFEFNEEKPVRNQDAKKIIAFVQKYGGTPFAERWLLGREAAEFGLPNSLFNIRIALKELVDRSILYTYPPLRDAKGGLVSQAEHTIIVLEDPIVTTR
jgi:methionyl aminopeptidase